jgi:sRNA-binding carbon storage regulator CsrA
MPRLIIGRELGQSIELFSLAGQVTIKWDRRGVNDRWVIDAPEQVIIVRSELRDYVQEAAKRFPAANSA